MSFWFAQLLDDFQSIDESLLRRVAERGGAGDDARHEISKKFLDAAMKFLSGTAAEIICICSSLLVVRVQQLI